MDRKDPMFQRESEMTAPASAWLRSSGLTIKSEFTLPWGVCDLVGVSFNQEHVEHRMTLRQTRSIGSLTRTSLLLKIPDVDSRRSVTFESLVNAYKKALSADLIARELEHLENDRFVVRNSRGSFQKTNGWFPLQKRLVAVELKLSRVEEAMQQARHHLRFAQESYVGLPMDVANHVASNRTKWNNSFDAGVGVLGVGKEGCEVLIPARFSQSRKHDPIQFYCVEKFWRTRVKDS
jgi:hypothetical protein